MPATPTKNKSCVTYDGQPKDRFKTREDARKELKRRYATGRYAPGTIGAYPCRHCDFFHIGHRRIDCATAGRRQPTKSKRGRRR